VKALATALGAVARCEGLRERAAERGPAIAAVHDWDALARAQAAVLRAAAGRPAEHPEETTGEETPDTADVTTRFPRPVALPREDSS
jgi:hypothetical protein